MIMDRFNLTAEEYIIIELVFLAIEENKPDALMAFYKLSCPHTDLGEILQNLQEKEVITKSCKFQKGESLDLGAIKFNEIFMRSYRKSSGALGQELFKAYPNEAIIQGQAVPLRNFSKKYNTEEDFYFNYGKAICWDVKKHQEVLDLIKWSKDNDHFGLNMNIGDFVGSKMWLSIKDHKEGSNSVTFDTLTTI